MELVTIQEAENLYNGKLDGRIKYYASKNRQPCEVTGAVLFKIAFHTGVCTSCCEGNELSVDSKCQECNGTGKIKFGCPIPIYKKS